MDFGSPSFVASKPDKKKLDFSEKGHSVDEIVLEFDSEENGQLYVSLGVLASASHVFKAMFQSDSKEAKEKKVEIKDFNIVDFREFLYCIDAGTLKPINGKH